MKLVNKTVALLAMFLVLWSQAVAQKDITYISINSSKLSDKEQVNEGFSIQRNPEVQIPSKHRGVESWINLGNSSSPWGSYNFPIDFFWNTSLSQSIYTEAEIDHEPCAIEEIKYFYKTQTTNYDPIVDTEPIRIWMANTSVTSIADEDGFWIPFNKFILVYDGTPTLTSGNDEELVFNLIEPFIYNGANICIMVERALSENSFMNHFNFKASTLPEGVVKSRLYASYETPFDFDILLDTLESNMSQAGMTLGNIADVSLGVSDAEGGSLSGVITNTDPAFVEGAMVTISGTDLEAYADENGEYMFLSLLNETHTVNVSAFGYVSQTITVEVEGST
ncbi:MAG: carboxypeptidase-like regulatory domain-containing protein, partial [Bacteroidales bacterium]|nr:carboxypeptidase-like regulatory domain-containing protein [Bacteroidales bacterium]